ncbi:MAG: hypothetical protein ACP5L5_00805 [Vulcanisaeta sp.]|jgi:hypothetical protein
MPMTMIMGIIIFFVLNVIYGKVSLESKGNGPLMPWIDYVSIT